MAKRLNEKQIAAIEYLAQPKRAGLTYKEIAEAVGVSEQSLHKWRKDDDFCKALNKRIIQVTQQYLPDVLEAAVKGVTEDRNAAIFRTLLQAHGLLTEKHEVETKENSASADAVKAEIERFKQRKGTSDSE